MRRRSRQTQTKTKPRRKVKDIIDTDAHSKLKIPLRQMAPGPLITKGLVCLSTNVANIVNCF